MARHCTLLIASLLVTTGIGVSGQAPESGSATPAATPANKKAENAWKKGRKGPYDGTPSPEFESVRQALNALTPAQRKRFEENFLRWANMSPDEKKALLDREQMRRKIMEKEIEVALRESGLQLEGERRAEFARRYTEERRKIEEQLRKEVNEKRKPLVHEMVGRLQAEFSASPAVTAAP